MENNNKLSTIIEYKNKKYKCANAEKFRRTIYGMDDSGNPRVPGIGENAKPEMILAVYDRLGGYIQNEDGFKVMSGAFCNYRASRIKEITATVINEKPEVILEATVNGIVYEWIEGDKVPWGEIVTKPERKRGEKNKRVRVKKPVEQVETKEVENEEPAKQVEKKNS